MSYVGGLRRCRAIAAGVSMVAAVALSGLTNGVPVGADPVTTPDPDWPVANGPVFSMTENGGTIILAGDFGMIGPQVNHLAFTDATTGERETPFIDVNGAVRSIIPDGVGGWYIGGNFTLVNGAVRKNAARIDANGALLQWNPDPNGPVNALALAGTRVLLGGLYSKVRGGLLARSNLVLVDGTTGQPVSNWNADTNGEVLAVAAMADNLRLAVGGTFTSIRGANRSNLAAVTVANGSVDLWAPRPNNTVNAIAVDGGRTYIGGTFTLVGITPRQRLIAVDSSTGVVDVAYTPNPNGAIYALAVAPVTRILHVGGSFTKIAANNRNNAAALSLAGALQTWNPNPSGAVFDIDLPAIGNEALISGNFTTVKGQPHARAAIVDRTTATPVASYDPRANHVVDAIASTPNGPLLGGEFTSTGASFRNKIAVIDALTGELQPDTFAAVDGPIRTALLSPDASTLYIGGFFNNVGGAARASLAAINMDTGQLKTGFDANLGGGGVWTLELRGSDLYVGGDFKTVNALPAANLLRVDRNTGARDIGWAPGVNGTVRSINLTADGTTLYTGGSFEKIGLMNRTYLGAIATSSALATSWKPTAYHPVITTLLSEADDALYIGVAGRVPNGNATARIHLNNNGQEWRVGGGGNIQTLALNADRSRVYSGGHPPWVTVSQIPRGMAYALNAADGTLLPWNPGLLKSSGVWDIIVRENDVLLAGGFISDGQHPVEGIARYPGTP